MPSRRRYSRRKRRRGRYSGRRIMGGSRGRRGPQVVSTFGSTIEVRQTGGSLRKVSSLRLYQPSIVPDSIFVKLKYADQQVVVPVGVTELRRYTGNGLIDPNLTITGSVNPLGFIEWMSFYNKYKVFGSKIEFLLYNSSQSIGIFFTVFPSFSLLAIPDYSSNSVQPYAVSGIVGQEPSGNNLAHINAYMSTKKLWGDQVFDRAFDGTISNNPNTNHLWHWNLFAISQLAVFPPLFTMQVNIIYYTKLFDRNALIQQSSPALMLAALERAERNGQLVSASEMNTNENPPPPSQRPIRIVEFMPCSAYRASDLKPLPSNLSSIKEEPKDILVSA